MKKLMLFILSCSLFISCAYSMDRANNIASLKDFTYKTIVKNIVSSLEQKKKNELADKLNHLNFLPQELYEQIQQKLIDEIVWTLSKTLRYMKLFNADFVKTDVSQIVEALPSDWQEKVKKEFVKLHTEALASVYWGPDHVNNDIERFDGLLRYRDNMDPHDMFGWHISPWKQSSFEALVDQFTNRLKSSPYYKKWQEEENYKGMIAFCMAQHPRLGENSPANLRSNSSIHPVFLDSHLNK